MRTYTHTHTHLPILLTPTSHPHTYICRNILTPHTHMHIFRSCRRSPAPVHRAVLCTQQQLVHHTPPRALRQAQPPPQRHRRNAARHMRRLWRPRPCRDTLCYHPLLLLARRRRTAARRTRRLRRLCPRQAAQSTRRLWDHATRHVLALPLPPPELARPLCHTRILCCRGRPARTCMRGRVTGTPACRIPC